MVPTAFSTRSPSWIAVLIGAVMLASCTSANRPTSAASSSRSATPMPTPCTPAASPPARMGAAMTYDAGRKTVVLFGGTRGDGGSPLDDTWTWDGCHWTQAKPAASPPGRSFGNLAFDASSGKVILFGGGHANSDPARNDTWSWDGSTWTQEHPRTTPPRLADDGLIAADPTNHQVVLFGTDLQGNQVPSTWTWDGSNWTQHRAPTTPPKRGNAAMAFGAKSGMLLFGGQAGEADTLNDTWVWDGSTWSQLRPSTKPAGGPAIMAHEDSRSDVLMVEQDGTWTWTGSNWTRQHPSAMPPFQLFCSLAYDAVRDRVVLFGGKNLQTNQATSDTWLWDGTTWSRASGS
ncbi:MAG: hypothetical protein E6I99_01345 [Chloroflexi bacterium]|nr:MAG: hypothetical protein E6I99_01345 [Chloroflexota bacterium]